MNSERKKCRLLLVSLFKIVFITINKFSNILHFILNRSYTVIYGMLINQNHEMSKKLNQETQNINPKFEEEDNNSADSR